MRNLAVAAVLGAVLSAAAAAQEWADPVRGSWVRDGRARSGDVTLVSRNTTCEIVVSPAEHSAVQQAAKFLAKDIETLTGKTPALVAQSSGSRPAIVLHTLGVGSAPQAANTARLSGQWEAYQVVTAQNKVHLIGSDFRGTAFAAYTLSERLGIDPLYIWTGYTPKKRGTLTVQATDAVFDAPTVKYRGLFHDDEDILPRPFDPRNGYPYVRGTVPDVWYERFFETALRLRMNMVAPYVRVKRHYRVQKMASEWGLFYTSHHYDILLSNPYGFTNFDLAKERGVSGDYDYINNRDGVLRYWKAGAEENRELDTIYPVGLRGTEDYGYRFPAGTTLEEKARVYGEVIREQVALAQSVAPAGRTPLFHLTLYGEMLENFQKGQFDVPENVLLIWDDDYDGIMRDLPTELGKWKHGVYYHLAFFASKAKQSVHTITPQRIAQEFRKIVDSGATEYMLLNVSELREHVMETRMVAEICWDAKAALAGPDPAARFINWWSREYFGADAAAPAAEAYNAYHEVLDTFDKVWYGSNRVTTATMQLMKKLNGEGFTALPAADVATLRARQARHRQAADLAARATARMAPEPQRFFFEHVQLGLALDRYPTEAALLLEAALQANDNAESRRLMEEALKPLEQMEADIRRAERARFQNWYRPTWIRPADFFHNHSHINVHRPYDMLRNLMEGLTRPQER